MHGQQLIVACESSISLAFLAVIALRLWPGCRLDVFRQKMFAIRDDLFAYAASGKISFHHPAYKLLRQSMNGFLRYGHNLTFFRLCVTLIGWNLAGRPATKWADAWLVSLEKIEDPQVRKDLQDFHIHSLSLVADRLIFGSPILWIAVICTVISLSVSKQWQGIKQIFRSARRKTLERIVDPNLLEEEASRLAAA